MIFTCRSNLTYTGVPDTTIVNETIIVFFSELTLTNPEGYDGSNCGDCDIVAEILYTPLIVELQNRPVIIDVTVTYGSIELMVCHGLMSFLQ